MLYVRGISRFARLVVSFMVCFLLYDTVIASAEHYSVKKHVGRNKPVKKKNIGARHKRHVIRKAKQSNASKRKVSKPGKVEMPTEAEHPDLRQNRVLTQEEEQKLLKERENKINSDIIE
jgi:hypothetical protein